jgi:hypothetical protein
LCLRLMYLGIVLFWEVGHGKIKDYIYPLRVKK